MPPIPTDAELEILAVLWRLGPATVREVYDQLGKKGAYTTALKQMQVMLEKGLLKRSERYRSHVYEAMAGESETQQQLAGELMRKAFRGSATNLVLGALRAQPASAEELAEIHRLVSEFEKRKDPT